MSRKGWRRIALALGTLMLALLVGCQSIGGFDPGKMIVNQLSVKSMESSSTFELHFDWDDEALAQQDPEAAKIADLFRTITLKSDHAMVDKDGNIAINGELAFAKAAIPFSLAQNADSMVLQIEGFKQPIVIQSGGGGLFPMVEEDQADNEVYQEAATKIAGELASYLFGHVSNPPVMNVEQVNESVHGESLNLTKVHAELNGEQLGGLLTEFMTSIAKDEEGLRQLLQQVIQLATTLPPEVLEEFGFTAEEAIPTETELDEFVKELMGSFAEARDQLLAEKSSPEWNEIFNEGLTFKTDLFIDSEMNIRKSDLEIGLGAELFKDSEIPLEGVTLHSMQETWNVNGDVEVPAADIPDNAMSLFDFYLAQPYEVLRQMDPTSKLYGLLKNDLEIDDQEFTASYYITDDNGDIYVPLRPTLIDFGIYDLTFIGKGKYIQFRDEAIQRTLQVQLGTNAAKVNGRPLQLKHEVRVVNGVGYVNADDLFGLMGAEYSVSKDENGDEALFVTRDL
ncbi:stalk domain-containing protein [Cohnella lubricantis]|uniref:Copper amine oxidase-like N-terminal domain-containing protein n=1 Tax=Cohnella lubricantis TaxID=2163172 RepID=A0A841TG99_9BACL|nr:stalk domain-containing protein [Cohnella lubricantis]MBB6678288.1 hypothetical protein [Cohnella lubricantis]MBP2118490.1 hypothetical protein [Cohnella lubricantis]